MHHGPAHDYMDSHADQIYDWVESDGQGIFSFCFGDIPDGCISFILSQFERFGIPCPAEITDVIVAAASSTFFFIDTVEPYSLFYGTSDVNITGDWAKYTFEINDPYVSGSGKEADPENTETFLMDPNQSQEVFDHCLARPGLDSLPFNIGDGIRAIMRGDYYQEDVFDAMAGDCELYLDDLCATPDGGVDDNKKWAYCELSAWAAFLWAAGPLGRQWRFDNNVIYEACLTHGSCILTENSVIPPEHFKIIERPPKSCYQCGTSAWCVELTQDGEVTRHICEHCLNGDLPNWGGIANCGSRYCRYATCQYHPFFGQENAMYQAHRHSGQLNGMAKSGWCGTILGEGNAKKFLSNG